jgi:hypothetical protein
MNRSLAGFLLKGLGISLSFALVFLLTYGLNQSYLRQMAQTRLVVTARSDLLPGLPLTADVLQLTEKPIFGLGQDYAESVEELMAQGPWYVGVLGVGAGDILRPGKLSAAAASGGDWRWEANRRGDARLIAVETTLVRSGGDWLWPGTRADALVYLPAKESYDDPQPARIIGPDDDPLLRDLLIIDKKNGGGLTLTGEENHDGYSRDMLPAVVTLMVDGGDTERIKALIRYNEEGRIYFSPTDLGVRYD